MNPRHLLIGCVALVAALGPARAGAQPAPSPSASVTALPSGEPTADEIIARSKAATGAERAPDSEHEVWSIRSSGLDGSVETWRNGNDTRTNTTVGPFRTARGAFHGDHWHQNDNGETILEKTEPSQIERVTLQTVARVREPLDAWLVTTTYVSGHVSRSYYDPRTFLLMRVDRTIAGRDSHTVYEDYRLDGRGRERSWHYFGGDDRPDNDYDYRLVRDEENPPIADDFFAVPKDRRILVEFPNGSESVRLPARIVDNRIYVRLEIGGRGLDFLLDSGSSALTIDATVAKQLGLGTIGHATQTIAGTFTSGRVVVPNIAIGPLAMHDIVMRTVPLSLGETPGVRGVGLLGFDFFDAVGLRIDYENDTIDAYRPGTIVPPPGALPLDVALNSGSPVVHVTVGDAAGDDFVVDTGAAFPYILFQRFVRAHPNAVSSQGDTAARYLAGVGGRIEYRSVTAKRLEFGAYTFDDAEGVETLAANAFGFDSQDGLIGADIVKLFTVYTDYAANRIYLGSTPRLQAVGARTAREALDDSARRR